MDLLPWIWNISEEIVTEIALESSSTSSAPSSENTENDDPLVRNPINTETLNDDTRENQEESAGTSSQEINTCLLVY